MIFLLLHALLGAAPAPGPVKEEVVVTAERGPETRADVPAAVSVLTREQIAHLPAETLAEVLRFLPGFQTFFASESSGTAPMVTARGFFGGGEAEYVQLRVDGVAVGDPESGLADWRRIRAADVERIEALRGPASSLYGDAALGGVVEVFTSAAAGGAAPGAWGSMSGGSFGGFSADALGRFDVAGAAASAGGSYARSDGERSHAFGERGGVEASAGGTAGSGVWRVAFAGTALDRDDPGALDAAAARADPTGSDPAYRFDNEATHRGHLSAEWSRQDGPLPIRVVMSGALRSSDILRTEPLAPGLFDRALRELDTSTVSIAADGERAFHLLGRDARLRFGVEAGRDGLDGQYRSVDDDGHSGEIVATSDGRRLRASAFVLQDWRPWERVRLTAGLRWDRISDDFTGTTSGDTTHQAWSPRVGVSVRLGASGATSVFAQWSRAFQAPTLDQLFDPRPFPDFAGGTFTVSNPNLHPQHAETVEAGGSGSWGALGWDAAVYRIAVDDEIDFDPATFTYVNIGRSLHTGVEANVKWIGAGWLHPFVSYAWTRVVARDGENAGLQLKNIPLHLLRAGLAASLPFGFRGEAIASRMFDRWADDAEQFPLRDGVLLDLRLERDFGPLTARLDAFNAAGVHTDAIGFTLPDFSGGEAPYYYPGPRRAVRVGLAYRP